MPRYDDEDDDRPRRRSRPRDDDDDDRPRGRYRDKNDDDDDDRPTRSRRDDDDDLPPPRRQKKGGGLMIVLIIVGVVLLLCVGGGGALIYFIYDKVSDAKETVVSSNNMKQIALGCHNYSDRHGTLPTNSYAPDGRALLSWRVHILPFVGQQPLYAKFKLDEPWDGPTNRRLLSEMPVLYATPTERENNKWGTTTFYRGFSNTGSLFEKNPAAQAPGAFAVPRGVPLMGVTDGISNTVLLVEAGDAVEWTKPDDLDFSPGRPLPKLGGVRPKATTLFVAFADGSVRGVRRTASEAAWRAAISYRGAEAVFLD